MMAETLRCHICSSTQLRPKPFGYRFNGKWLQAIECAGCRVIFIHPQPAAAEISQLYSKEYFDADFRCGHEGSYFDENTLKGIVDHALLQRIKNFKPGVKFLEIGCAGGAFLDAARQVGYEVCGVEFSKDAARFARERFDLRVVTGDLMDARFEHSTFDVVFMGDVIEHLPDPVMTLKEINRIMAEGGLVVLACPTQTNSLFSRLGFVLFQTIGKRATVALPPYHLFEYRPRSMASLLERSGFAVASMSEGIISPGKVTLRGSTLQKTGKKVLQYPNFILTRMFGIFGDRLEAFAVKRA